MSRPTSPLLALSGAVAADPPDEGVAAHYGDPLREQRHLDEGPAVVDRSNRDVVRVAGPDRLSWLHSLTTQHLSGLAAGAATEALILDPHGRVEHHLALIDDGTASWLQVEPGTADALVAFLDSMRFLLRVEVADVSADWAVLTVAGATPPAGLVSAARRWPAGSVDVLVPRADLAETVAVLAAPPAGMWAYEALRVAARAPRLGRETDARTIPHEVGWIDVAVHLDKGCYRGQETVARVHNLGRPPRRLVLVHLDGSMVELPDQGEPVTAQGRPVGWVGTATRHYELGPIALAVVKRSVPDDATLQVGGVAAAIDPVSEGMAASPAAEQARTARPVLTRFDRG